MLRVLVCLKRDREVAQPDWNTLVLQKAESLSVSWKRASVTLRDHSNEGGLTLINTGHPCDSLISFVTNDLSKSSHTIQSFAELGATQSYVASQSEPLEVTSKVDRVDGFCQVAFIKRPKDLSRTEFLSCWLEQHTQIAINTQSTFGYRQNIINFALPLSAGELEWPLMDAIVEENFPAAALDNAEVFFDAVDDPERLQLNQSKMNDSCQQFIDFQNFDCVPMSQFILK